MTFGHSDKDYRVAFLSKSYLTTTRITMQCLKLIGQLLHAYINDKSYPGRRTE